MKSLIFMFALATVGLATVSLAQNATVPSRPLDVLLTAESLWQMTTTKFE